MEVIRSQSDDDDEFPDDEDGDTDEKIVTTRTMDGPAHKTVNSNITLG